MRFSGLGTVNGLSRDNQISDAVKLRQYQSLR
jgi:hypothetical protein